jgi:hypothetical protein
MHHIIGYSAIALAGFNLSGCGVKDVVSNQIDTVEESAPLKRIASSVRDIEKTDDKQTVSLFKHDETKQISPRESFLTVVSKKDQQVVQGESQMVHEKGQVVHDKGQVVHDKGKVVHDKGKVVHDKGRVVHDKGRVVHDKGKVVHDEERQQVAIANISVPANKLGDTFATVGKILLKHSPQEQYGMISNRVVHSLVGKGDANGPGYVYEYTSAHRTEGDKNDSCAIVTHYTILVSFAKPDRWYYYLDNISVYVNDDSYTLSPTQYDYKHDLELKEESVKSYLPNTSHGGIDKNRLEIKYRVCAKKDPELLSSEISWQNKYLERKEGASGNKQHGIGPN